MTRGTGHASRRLPNVSAGELDAPRTLLQMRASARRITGRRNRLLAHALWKRDGGLCRRCALPIDPTLHGYLPGALTIGHIVPLSQGGTDDPRNLAAEHRRCNLAAGDRGDRPLPAIVSPLDDEAKG